MNFIRQINIFGKTSSLSSNTLFYAISVLFERAISFLVIPIITKSLPTESYGIWTQIIITSSLLSGILLLGFATSSVKFLAGTSSSLEKSSIINWMLLVVLLTFVVVTCFAISFKYFLAKIIWGDPLYHKYTSILTVYLFSEVFFELQLSFMRADSRIALISIYYLFKNACKVGSLATFVIIFNWNFQKTLWLLTLIQLFISVWIYAKEIFPQNRLYLRINQTQWKNILTYSLPLVPYAILIGANCSIGRYIILRFLELKQLSIFALAYSLSAIVALLYTVLGYTLYPHLAALWNKKNSTEIHRLFNTALQYYLFAAFPFIIWLTLCNKSIVLIFSTHELLASNSLYLLLTCGFVVFGLYQFFNYLLLLGGKTKLNLIFATIGFFINISLSILLIRPLEITGIAIAGFVSNLIIALLTMREELKTISLTISLPFILKLIFSNIAFLAILLVFISVANIEKIGIFTSASIVSVSFYLALDLLMPHSLLRKLRSQ